MLKFVIFDFDGVFTDGKCYFDDNNNIKKYYNIKDGMALSILKNNNIKSGLISSYSTDKNILLNEKKIDDNILSHLKFDYCYIGNDKKINVLCNWLKELNITFDDVAYVGDDINDIEIMEMVKFSACPNDASEECKNVVNYICKRNGGEGCVREFVDKILNGQNENLLIQEIKREMNYQIDNFNLDEIDKIVKLIDNGANVYTTGIGKSENIANHLSCLLKSISINAYFLNAVNALHGDIGTLKVNDIVLMFSKSGNTNELIDLATFLKERKCIVIGICCDENNKFKHICDFVINIPFRCEISGSIDKIPTNSYMSMLFFSNILVSKLKINIQMEQYRKNHPQGFIGYNLRKIKDCMIYEFPKILYDNKDIKLNDILFEMTKYKMGCCIFINIDNSVIGILTDGDIRRLLLIDEDKKFITYNNINTNYYYEENINKLIYECKKISYIPIIVDLKLIGVCCQ